MDMASSRSIPECGVRRMGVIITLNLTDILQTPVSDCFMPLMTGCVPKERKERLLQLLKDENKFWESI